MKLIKTNEIIWNVPLILNSQIAGKRASHASPLQLYSSDVISLSALMQQVAPVMPLSTDGSLWSTHGELSLQIDFPVEIKIYIEYELVCNLQTLAQFNFIFIIN